MLASLNHPGIASVFGLEESNGIRGIVMELVEGTTLADRLVRGPITIDEALHIEKPRVGPGLSSEESSASKKKAVKRAA